MPPTITLSSHSTTPGDTRRRLLGVLAEELRLRGARALLSLGNKAAPILYVELAGRTVSVVAAQAPSGWLFLWGRQCADTSDCAETARLLTAPPRLLRPDFAASPREPLNAVA